MTLKKLFFASPLLLLIILCQSCSSLTKPPISLKYGEFFLSNLNQSVSFPYFGDPPVLKQEIDHQSIQSKLNTKASIKCHFFETRIDPASAVNQLVAGQTLKANNLGPPYMQFRRAGIIKTYPYLSADFIFFKDNSFDNFRAISISLPAGAAACLVTTVLGHNQLEKILAPTIQSLETFITKNQIKFDKREVYLLSYKNNHYGITEFYKFKRNKTSRLSSLTSTLSQGSPHQFSAKSWTIIEDVKKDLLLSGHYSMQRNESILYQASLKKLNQYHYLVAATFYDQKINKTFKAKRELTHHYYLQDFLTRKHWPQSIEIFAPQLSLERSTPITLSFKNNTLKANLTITQIKALKQKQLIIESDHYTQRRVYASP